MATDYISLLLQLPVVGIFVWFVLKLTVLNLAAQEKRDAEWRDFLGGERTARSEGMARMAEELKEVAIITSATQALLTQHDQRTSAAMPQIEKILERVKNDQR